MSDDRWRDTYDAWKLACPYDDEPEKVCEVCGCEETDHRGLLTCRCPARDTDRDYDEMRDRQMEDRR